MDVQLRSPAGTLSLRLSSSLRRLHLINPVNVGAVRPWKRHTEMVDGRNDLRFLVVSWRRASESTVLSVSAQEEEPRSFLPPPFFWFPCVYVRMKGHSYKLTRRLKHKETLYNGEMKKENQNRCRNGLQSVQHILFFCYGFIRRIAMLFFFNLSIYTPSKKANRQKTPTKSHHYFSRMSICFCTSLIYSVWVRANSAGLSLKSNQRQP